jgi:ABC-type siderophore export system fused ATPase/permease subunit
MTDSDHVIETSEDNCAKSMKKWERACRVSNIILSIVYVPGGWIFGFLGLMFFSLGLPDAPFTAICSFVASLLFLLTPVFCILGILFSVLLRKKNAFVAAFLIQFLPFMTLGIALVSFFLSII